MTSGLIWSNYVTPRPTTEEDKVQYALGTLPDSEVEIRFREYYDE